MTIIATARACRVAALVLAAAAAGAGLDAKPRPQEVISIDYPLANSTVGTTFDVTGVTDPYEPVTVTVSVPGVAAIVLTDVADQFGNYGCHFTGVPTTNGRCSITSKQTLDPQVATTVAGITVQ